MRPELFQSVTVPSHGTDRHVEPRELRRPDTLPSFTSGGISFSESDASVNEVNTNFSTRTLSSRIVETKGKLARCWEGYKNLSMPAKVAVGSLVVGFGICLLTSPFALIPAIDIITFYGILAATGGTLVAGGAMVVKGVQAAVAGIKKIFQRSPDSQVVEG